MNSEELEKSLRTEFESHLKTVLAEMRQELDGFQEKFETEIENHKNRLGDVLQDFSARLNTGKELDEGFKKTVVEHLRLARDEGARITAEAISEAEDMEKKSAPSIRFNELRDAVSEISSQGSQAEILKSLVNHAVQYVPRGAFFIVKNEHFVGWRVFGKEAEMDDTAVREVFFSVSDSTVLGESVRSLATVESSYGTYDDDAAYLEKLDFGQPDRMYALPLIARGRGVAVLYADYGHEGTNVNIEALETLMRVAGMTVELLAASRGSKSRTEEPRRRDEYSEQAKENAAAEYAEAQSFGGIPAVEEVQTEPQQSESYTNYQSATGENAEPEYQTAEIVESTAEDFETVETPVEETAEENYYQPEIKQTESYSKQDFSDNSEYQTEAETSTDFQFVTENAETDEVESAKEIDYSMLQSTEAETFVEEEMQEISSPEYEESKVESVSEETSWSQPVESNGYSYEYAPEEISEVETPAYESSVSQSDFHIPASSGYEFESSRAEEVETASVEEVREVETPQADVSHFEKNEVQPTTIKDFSSAPTSSSFASYESQTETQEPAYAEPVETVRQAMMSQPVKARFSERHLDLPIDVAEDERRLHNDARRFARLLVSEIKLYNEQKVNEGRTSYDLYERLRESIDRSREMYDKRVQPPVAAKFDYFHYELVNSLAESDEAKLGGSYPGTNV
ncbi:MAG: hypothetical protein ABIP06_14120 [Pyrinomonadaceae bacterium]